MADCPHFRTLAAGVAFTPFVMGYDSAATAVEAVPPAGDLSLRHNINQPVSIVGVAAVEMAGWSESADAASGPLWRWEKRRSIDSRAGCP